MVISLNDVDIIGMPRMNIGELNEPYRLSAWYRPLFHFAYTFAHILPNATLAFAVLVINTHCSGKTAYRVDGCIKQISICPLCLVWVRAPRWHHVRQANVCLRVCQVFFSGISRFRPPTDWPVSYELK